MRKEIKISIVVIAGIVILFFGMNFLKGLHIFSNDNPYYITFDDVDGLSPSSPIYANGYKVGTVKQISFDYEEGSNIKVTVGLDKRMKVPTGSRAEIVSDLLGNLQVNLLLGDKQNGLLPVGGQIDGRKHISSLSQAADLLPQVESLLPKLDSILYSLNILFADPAIRNSLHNVEKITNDLTLTTNHLNSLLSSVNKQVPTLMQKANSTLDNAQTLTSNLSEVDINGTMNRINNTLNNIEQFSSQLNSNTGSLGLLMKDRSVYDNINSTISHADSLMMDLKQNPKRYVHFSVFGKKDKKQ